MPAGRCWRRRVCVAIEVCVRSCAVSFRAAWHQPTPAPCLTPLTFRITNGVPYRFTVVWGEPNLRYVIQVSPDLTTWSDLPLAADEGTEYTVAPSNRTAFYRAVLRP